MDKATFDRAKDLDSRMGIINYHIMAANRVRTAGDIRVIEANPDGSICTIAELPKGDKLRETIADELLFRLGKEMAAVQEEFNNL